MLSIVCTNFVHARSGKIFNLETRCLEIMTIDGSDPKINSTCGKLASEEGGTTTDSSKILSIFRNLFTSLFTSQMTLAQTQQSNELLHKDRLTNIIPSFKMSYNYYKYKNHFMK